MNLAVVMIIEGHWGDDDTKF